jgi:aldehyde dehydrogenase (NAD+)
VDAPACAAILRYYAGWADKITGRTIPIGSQHFCYTLHEPVGVCGLIVPWNLPLIAVAAKIGPALVCGNTVVLKTAEQTPLTALRVAELALEAGFPPGVINIISGYGPTTGAEIVRHPLVDKISFTGSVEVGKKIQAMAGDGIKRVTLELGGNNPMIVFADCDVEQAVETVHNGLFWNEGQACAAGSRVFIEDSIYDKFVEKSIERAKKRRVGNPFDSSSQQGSQVSEEQFNKVLGYIASAQQEGARLVLGGRRIGTKGYYLEPTIFSNVTDKMKVFAEEVFGPVLTLNRFSAKDGLDAIIARANATEYGLAAGVFTKDVTKGNAVTRRLRAGMVFWNCYHVVDISAPFGGMKHSGFGREGGEYGLLPYLEVKMVAQQVA